ncbi:hypothetical protein GIB67_022247 [Kingdonia uniflora]|uniref:Nuclear transcription factor Y subunit n=1 Tax=Kingdonia uniflora TaxID=39325 RepID=A0A7J7M6X9_9MAGN|nr:hypothetical protein GIB67_022247 [Kingdonia uniflora]
MTSSVQDQSSNSDTSGATSGADEHQQQPETQIQSESLATGVVHAGMLQLPEYVMPHHLELGHAVAPTAYPYPDPYYRSIFAPYCAQPMIHPHPLPHSMGIQAAAVPLPSDAIDEPVFVNPKQYRGILRRRESRAKAESENKMLKCRKPYLHESRHLHAVRRARGCGGRFLNGKPDDQDQDKMDSNDKTQSEALNSDKNTNSRSALKPSETDMQQELVRKAMLQNHGKMLERISMFTTRDNTLSLRDGTLFLGQYQYSTSEIIANQNREEKDGKRKKKNKKAEETDVQVEGIKIKALTDEQFDDDVQLIVLQSLIPKGNNRNGGPRKKRPTILNLKFDKIPSTEENLIQKVSPVEGVEWQKGAMEEEEPQKEKDDEDGDDDEKAKSYQEDEPQVFDEEEAQKEVAEQAKTEVVVFLQEEDVDEANQVINVYVKALNQYFDSQHRARPVQEMIVLIDVFSNQIIGRAFNVWTRIMSSPEAKELKQKSNWAQITSLGWDSTILHYFDREDLKPNSNDCRIYMLVFLDSIIREMRFLAQINCDECRYTIVNDILRLGVKPESDL